MSEIDVNSKNGFYCIEPCPEIKQLKRENERYIQCINEIEEYCNKYGQNSIGFKKKIQAFIKEVKE